MQSVLSFPERGHWGDRQYRGNCSGHIQRELIEHYRPSYFVDICEGSGTSKDVCSDLGVQYTGLDLRYGQDYTHDFVLSQLSRPADMVFSHPAYHSMILYSGNMWGEPDARDHSRCASVEEFLEKSQVMLLNQREATRPGGIYATLIGDMRKQGAFHSFQADFVAMMPRHELKGVVIKIQHNMVSNQTVYANFKHPSIQHEYLLLWERSKQSLFQVIWDKAIEQKRAIASTWRSLIRLVMMEVGQASLQEIYSKVESIAGDMIVKNQHWKAKIRQQLQKYHTQVERGVWAA
ncbi:MAG: hypothetical protein IBX55_02015 [Methyloprofundus sp.]|nr:hypothetical protein [Methyloprofundus sp.]